MQKTLSEQVAKHPSLGEGLGRLFITFFKIGIFTLGGGYAMIPLIEEEVVNKHRWVSKDEMLDLIAIAQSCPGVFAINIAIFIGYKLKKERGAIATTLGTALPSFLIILAIAMFFSHFKDNKVVAALFRGIRPAVVALIAVPTFNMAKRAQLNKWTLWIPIVSALVIWLMGVSPIWVIIVAGVGGYAVGKLKGEK
ncbi:chromate transporter [Prevotellaceae bacterium HUN156]|nr:chromate transporter [Prevotellaceae bacterium HUN156]